MGRNAFIHPRLICVLSHLSWDISRDGESMKCGSWAAGCSPIPPHPSARGRFNLSVRFNRSQVGVLPCPGGNCTCMRIPRGEFWLLQGLVPGQGHQQCHQGPAALALSSDCVTVSSPASANQRVPDVWTKSIIWKNSVSCLLLPLPAHLGRKKFNLSPVSLAQTTRSSKLSERAELS